MSEFLPEELVVKILARLSTKDLSRFKCVCKSWRGLINSRYFADKYRDISPTKFVSYYNKALYLLAMEDNNPVITNPFQLNLSFDQNSIDESTCVPHCNGTLCITLKNHNLMICNPSSKQFKILPNPGIFQNWNIFGFGYDSVHDDYKIVTFIERLESSTAYVFEFRTGSWRESLLIPKPDWYYRERVGTFLNQYLYWIAYRSKVNRFVLGFNLSTHQYHKVSLPVCNKGVTSSYLGVTAQKLCIADYEMRKNEIRISVLENNGSWNMIKSLSLLNLISGYEVDFVSFTKKNDVFVSLTECYDDMEVDSEERAKKKVLLCKNGEKILKQIPYCNSLAGFRFLGEYVETPVINNRIFI